MRFLCGLCIGTREQKRLWRMWLRIATPALMIRDIWSCRLSVFPSSGSIYSLPIATSTKTFSTFTFSTCKIHTTISRLEGSTICKSIMGNKILCSMLTVTLIIMCLFFQVAAVSGNKGLAELIANFTERDIGTLMLLWESKVSSWWFHHCVKQFLRVQLNCSFSGVDFGRVA